MGVGDLTQHGGDAEGRAIATAQEKADHERCRSGRRGRLDLAAAISGFIAPAAAEGALDDRLDPRLAQRLASCGHRVDVITTCALDHSSWRNELPAGSERDGALTVRRFAVDDRDLGIHGELERAITAEGKAGRGSPHGGVFLDIASRVPDDVIKRKLPSMYHQFMQLANLDITTTPMEVGPTTHYIMGGIRVDADTQESTVPGLFAAGECAAGINGANRLGGNSLSDIIVFGKHVGQEVSVDGIDDLIMQEDDVLAIQERSF